MKNNLFKIGLAFILSLAVLGLFGLLLFPAEKKITIRGAEFRVEEARTEEGRALGLGEREALCRECAMLFFFPEKARHSFWMKGMRFPLDILWWDSADGRIVHIEKNIPADSQKIYTSPGNADRVLEINAGLCEEYGIEVGDKIQS